MGRIVYNGVLYTTSSLGTFAVDAATCELIWKYTHPPGYMFQPNNKGAAIADGRIVRGFPDGHLIALDAKTGALLWDRVIMDSTAGEFATAAPVVWKGMIFLGKAGGDMGIRGEMMAFRTSDGEKIWGFNTIPGRGETGSDTWENASSIAHGGGGTWTSYSLDPSAGLLLVPVGNPGPDFANEARPGTNLFTNSLVALDAMTGKLQWWHQLLGPDDRDWDTSVVAAFDSADHGRLAAVAGKDGVLHVVDRGNGNFGSRRRSCRSTPIEQRLSPPTLHSAYVPSRRCNGMGPPIALNKSNLHERHRLVRPSDQRTDTEYVKGRRISAGQTVSAIATRSSRPLAWSTQSIRPTGGSNGDTGFLLRRSRALPRRPAAS